MNKLFQQTQMFAVVCSFALIAVATEEQAFSAQPPGDKTVREKKSAPDKGEASKADKQKSGKTEKSEKQKTNSSARDLTPDREKAALQFVKKHHAVLFELVQRLKKVSPEEYQRAVRDLAQSSEKLGRMKDRDPNRYAIELKAWQAKSRGELLAAQLQMDDSLEIRKQLRDVLIEETDLRIELLKLEESRLSERLDKIAKNIESMSESREKNADRRLEQYTRSFSSKRKSKEVTTPNSEKPKKLNDKKPTNKKTKLSNP